MYMNICFKMYTEKLQSGFSEIMIQYTRAFTHVPLEDPASALALINLALGALGIQDASSTALATVSRGIRSDTYSGYTVLH